MRLVMNSPPATPSRGEHVTRDLLSSIVVFLVALPLCMGISIASGAPVSAGLVSGIIGGIIVGALAGSPLQVSGPAAGLTVIVFECIQTHGLEMLGLIVLLAGAMQIAAGTLRLGQWFRAVSPAVVLGMLAGIGVLIFASQFHVMLDDKPQGSGIKNLATIPAAIMKTVQHPVWPSDESRRGQRELIQSLGEVHRRQTQLTERVFERVPHHDPDSTEIVTTDLSDLTAEQQAIENELNRMMEEATAVYSQPRKVERIRQRYQQALAAQDKAAAGLAHGSVNYITGTQQSALTSIELLQASLKNHELAAGLGVFTILLLIGWKKLCPARLKLVPGPLVAVILTTVVAAVWSLPVLYVEVPDAIHKELHFPTWTLLTDAPWTALLGSAALLAVVASAETLLAATAIDQLHDGPRAKYDKELVAQGIGNSLCGLVGALPITGVIVRSSANVQAGAKTRLSAIFHGLWLLVFVVAFGTVLRMVPTACLAGILVYTGYKLIDVKAIRRLREFGWGEVAIYLVTVGVIVVDDLLTGVVVGIILALVKLIYTFSHLKTRIETKDGGKRVSLKLQGAATFIRLPQLAAELERVPQGADFHVDVEQLAYIDHACLDLLMNWSKQHESTGGTTTIDWDFLHMTVRNGPPTTGEKTRVA
jgi:MFS superfamily sulfate permease-like transporter